MKDALHPTTSVLIAGGGPAGMTLGCLLGAAGVPCVIAERACKPESTTDIRAEALADASVYERICREDARASAIAAGTVTLLKNIGVWRYAEDFAAPINDILVTDGNAPSQLHWSREDNNDAPMGYMLPNSLLLAALRKRLSELQENVTFRYESGITSYEEYPGGVRASDASGNIHTAQTLVICDGRQSPLRNAAGICARSHDYQQTALVCTVRHEKPHRGLAQERFFPEGPFATLPLKDPYMSAIVWTLSASEFPQYEALNAEHLLRQLNAVSGDILGEYTEVFARAKYPLNLILADEYAKGHVFVAGDAAHGIHPLAGQGYNLSARGLHALCEAMIAARNSGLPLYDASVGAAYKRARMSDVPAMAAMTHAVNGIFGTQSKTITMARRAGLSLINNITPLKRGFMRKAMGVIQ